MMIVFALGMSSPDSMIVVQTRTSAAPSANASITFSRRALGHLAVPDDEPRARQHPAELLGLRLDRLDAVVDVEDLAAAIELAQDRVADEPGRRLGDAGLDRQAVLRRRLDDATGRGSPASARLSVRGIGVADRVRTSTSRRSRLSRSLAATPNRCSSSTTTSPRSLNRTSLLSSRCVPMTMSTVPSARPSIAAACSFARHEPRQQPDLEREGGEPLAERRVVLRGEDRRRARGRRPACRPASP